MSHEIPELKAKCPACDNGKMSRVSFQDATKTVQKTCSVCSGRGWIWALDQQEMAERIDRAETALAAANRRIVRLDGILDDVDASLCACRGDNKPGCNCDIHAAHALIAARAQEPRT